MPAYAIAITEDNIRGVIASEAGLGFDSIYALRWLKDHGEGWFVRDEGNPLDCQFFRPEIFEEMYIFSFKDETDLIRSVIKI